MPYKQVVDRNGEPIFCGSLIYCQYIDRLGIALYEHKHWDTAKQLDDVGIVIDTGYKDQRLIVGCVPHIEVLTNYSKAELLLHSSSAIRQFANTKRYSPARAMYRLLHKADPQMLDAIMASMMQEHPNISHLLRRIKIGRKLYYHVIE